MDNSEESRERDINEAAVRLAELLVEAIDAKCSKRRKKVEPPTPPSDLLQGQKKSQDV